MGNPSKRNNAGGRNLAGQRASVDAHPPFGDGQRIGEAHTERKSTPALTPPMSLFPVIPDLIRDPAFFRLCRRTRTQVNAAAPPAAGPEARTPFCLFVTPDLIRGPAPFRRLQQSGTPDQVRGDGTNW